jgi:uracil-DNA glycosylase family 4
MLELKNGQVQTTRCSPYLIRQLELIKPKVIVAFGAFAAQTGITVT